MACRIAIRVTPRSSKPGIGDWRSAADGREKLEVRVSEAPTDGAANDAVIRLLAKALGLSRSAVTIVSGHTSRHKRIEVPLNEEVVRARLAR